MNIHSPLKDFFWQQRVLERALISICPEINILKGISPNILSSFNQLEALRTQFTLPKDLLASVHVIHKDLAAGAAIQKLHLIKQTDLPIVKAFQSQQTRLDELSHLFKKHQLVLNNSILGVLKSAASTEALLGLNRIHPSSLNLALLPQIAFQKFAENQYLAAKSVTDLGQQNRLRLVEAGMQLLTPISKGFELASLFRPDAEEIDASGQPGVNVYEVIESEIDGVDFADENLQPEDVFNQTCAAQITEKGAQIIYLVYNLNLESEREGNSPIFKPTNKGLLACSAIPRHIAEDQDSFYSVVDHLYFVLYEGSGEAKRLTERYDANAFEPLWRLKHLRLSARHDVDHGDDGGITKKNQKIGEAFRALIGSVSPRTRNDWSNAQLTLYTQLCDMLQQIWLGVP